MMVLTFPPVTRLSAIEEAPGWMNCTVEPAGIPKALQVRIALFVVWVITDLVEDGVESVALPACTWKPDSPLEEPADAPLPPHDSAATSAVVVSRMSRNKLLRRALRITIVRNAHEDVR